MKEKKFFWVLAGLVVFAEFVIFFTAYKISGEKKWIQVRSHEGQLVYEVKGDRLPSFDKYYFENNFGNLKDYKIRLVEKKVSFPVRGWLFASIAFPVGFSFIFIFIIKVISSIFPSFKNKFGISDSSGIDVGEFRKIRKKEKGLNFYYFGILLLGGSFILWALPIIFNSAAERFLYQISRYPVIFSVFFAAFFLIVLYVFFLRFKLRKFDLEKKYMLEIKKIESGNFLGIESGNNEKTYYLSNKNKKPDNNGDKNL